MKGTEARDVGEIGDRDAFIQLRFDVAENTAQPFAIKLIGGIRAVGEGNLQVDWNAKRQVGLISLRRSLSSLLLWFAATLTVSGSPEIHAGLRFLDLHGRRAASSEVNDGT